MGGLCEKDWLREQLHRDPNQFLEFKDSNGQQLYVKRSSIVAFVLAPPALRPADGDRDDVCYLLLQNGGPVALHLTEKFDSVKERIIGTEFVPEGN